MVRLIYGDHSSLIALQRRQLIAEAVSKGKSILTDPSEEEINTLFSGFFPPEPTLIVLGEEVPSKWPDFWTSDANVDFLILVPKIKKFSWMDRVTKQNEIKAPKPWEEEDAATIFVHKTLTLNRRIIPDDIARAIVTAVGTDYGILSFEIWKILMASSEGETLSIDTIKQVVSPSGSPDGEKIISAIARRNPKSLVLTMDKIEKNSSSDPTMMITLAFLQPTFIRWHFCQRAGSADAAASALSMNKWVVENKIYPLATLVGSARTGNLIKAVAAAHAAVSEGKRAWDILKFGILNSM